jgi:hypothetical protein
MTHLDADLAAERYGGIVHELRHRAELLDAVKDES